MHGLAGNRRPADADRTGPGPTGFIRRGLAIFISGDAGGTKYSPLAQIDASNVSKLKIAWRWKSENYGSRPDYNLEVTPLAINGKLFFSAGAHRAAIAVDGATGETLWTYRLEEGERGDRAPRNKNRGVAYWSDEAGHGRVLMISRGYQLVELDADTGVPVKDFGSNGVVDLWVGLLEGTGRQVEPGQIGASSPAIVVGDVVVVGAAMLAGGAPRSKTNVPGFVRGYSTRTGKLLWTFHTIPRLGEFGIDTWKDDSWQYTGNTGVWAPMAADLELGYVYLPIEMPTGDYYGGHRPGANLFGDSLVCLNAKTGERIWHFQTVHHDIWDWDLASQPVLLDVTVDGKPVKAVAQITKQAFTFVFDRVTGEAPLADRGAARSGLDCTRRNHFTHAAVPHLAAQFDPRRHRAGRCERSDAGDQSGGTAHPLRVQNRAGVHAVDSPRGGWKEGHADRSAQSGRGELARRGRGSGNRDALHPSETTWWASAMVPGSTRGSDMNYVGAFVRVDTPFGLPLVKGPWGRITAIDMHTGDQRWMVPNGHAPKAVADNPKLAGVDLSGVGQPERAPLLVTKTLLFSGDGSGMFSSGPNGGGPLFRALDKATGKTLHEMSCPRMRTAFR